MNAIMIARDKPVSPVEKILARHQSRGTVPSVDLLEQVWEETLPWYKLVLEVFQEVQDEQEAGANLFRRLLATILISLSFREEKPALVMKGPFESVLN